MTRPYDAGTEASAGRDRPRVEPGSGHRPLQWFTIALSAIVTFGGIVLLLLHAMSVFA